MDIEKVNKIVCISLIIIGFFVSILVAYYLSQHLVWINYSGLVCY